MWIKKYKSMKKSKSLAIRDWLSNCAPMKDNISKEFLNNRNKTHGIILRAKNMLQNISTV